MSTLHIVQDNIKTEKSIEEIFDTKRFDTFTGVTFSVSPNFMNRYLEGFQRIKVVVGIQEDHVQKRANDAAVALTKRLGTIIGQEQTKMYQSLSTQVKEKLANDSVKLLVPLTHVIHSKFYLMSHSETNETRLVLGSANLSEQAFNKSTNQMENIVIFDNHDLFDVYKAYFEEELVPLLVDYMPKELVTINAKKVESYQKEKQHDVDEVILLNNEDLENIKVKAIEEVLLDTDKKVALGVLPVSIHEEMRNISDNLQHEQKRQKEVQEQQETAHMLVKESVLPRAKVAKLKPKATIQKLIQKKVKVKIKKSEESELPERDLMINSPSQRNLPKNITGLFVPSETDTERLLPIGRKASNKVITEQVQILEEIIAPYRNYTVRYDDAYGARVFEAILYAFTSPMMFEVKRKARSDQEKNDIPQFLFLGGDANSGKSSLLKILSKLTNTPTVMDYNKILPNTGHYKKKILREIETWMEEENVMPLLIDEISDDFFSNKSHGGELIVNTMNDMVSREGAFPVLIGTTNAKKHNLEERAARRSYYLRIDKVFQEGEKSTLAYNNVYKKLDNTLFLDFLVRFSEKLVDDSLNWAQFNGEVHLDFLHHTREIFKEYYEIAGIPLPNHFPQARFDDLKESDQERWRQKYLGTDRELFKFDDYTGNLFFNTSSLDANAVGYSAVKESEIYKNALSPHVSIGSNDGDDVELHTVEFFKWININNPYRSKYISELKAYYLENKEVLRRNKKEKTITMNMEDVVSGRQLGAVTQYKSYVPVNIIQSIDENHNAVFNEKELCEWLAVDFRMPGFFARLKKAQ